MTLLIGMPGGTEWVLIFVALGILIIPLIFYIRTLQSTLLSIAQSNRKMPPVNVWLLLIPVFGTIWHFIVINKMADSIKAELMYKNIALIEEKPGYNIGLATCILNCTFYIPGLNIFTGLAALVCWIVYWVKIDSYKTQIRRGIVL